MRITDKPVQERSRRCSSTRSHAEGRYGPNGRRICPSGRSGHVGLPAYERWRDLATLIPALWPHEINDRSQAGRRRIVECLARAIGAERRRALAGRDDYNVTRHLALFSALKLERAGLVAIDSAANRNGPEAIDLPNSFPASRRNKP